MIDILLMYTITAAAFSFTKSAASSDSVFFLSFVHLAPAGLLFLLWWILQGAPKGNASPTLIAPLLGVSAFLYTITDVGCFLSLEKVPASHGALISSLMPFVAAFFGYFFFGESLTLRKTCALFLGFLGVLPILLDNFFQHDTSGASQYVQGYAWMFCSITAYVLVSFIFKKLFAQKLTLPFVVGNTLLFGGLISLGISAFLESWPVVPHTVLFFFSPLGLVLFVAHNIAAPFLYAYTIKRYPVTLIMFLSLTIPLISAVLDFIFFHQMVRWPFFVSLIIFGAALALFFSKEKKTAAC